MDVLMQLSSSYEDIYIGGYKLYRKSEIHEKEILSIKGATWPRTHPIYRHTRILHQIKTKSQLKFFFKVCLSLGIYVIIVLHTFSYVMYHYHIFKLTRNIRHTRSCTHGNWPKAVDLYLYTYIVYFIYS